MMEFRTLFIIKDKKYRNVQNLHKKQNLFIYSMKFMNELMNLKKKQTKQSKKQKQNKKKNRTNKNLRLAIFSNRRM